MLLKKKFLLLHKALVLRMNWLSTQRMDPSGFSLTESTGILCSLVSSCGWRKMFIYSKPVISRGLDIFEYGEENGHLTAKSIRRVLWLVLPSGGNCMTRLTW